MDGRGGCCIARYATGAYDMSKVQRIMLRFRPIAPKPTTGSTNSGSSSESSDAFPKGRRPKRKYVRDGSANNSKRCNRRRKLSPEQNGRAVTLPLLPETPDPKNPPAIDPTVRAPKDLRKNSNVPVWLNFENENIAPGKVDPPMPFWYPNQSPMRAAGSCVTVECVTETWVEGDGGLGGTDEERAVKLSKDTCPAFISDGYGRVTWTNGAYRSKVGQGGGGEQGVRLVMKEKVGMGVRRAVVGYPSFTCKVRVEYTCGNKKTSLTVPCDVWRMDSGGFAWRLDVKAALSLSLVG